MELFIIILSALCVHEFISKAYTRWQFNRKLRRYRQKDML